MDNIKTTLAMAIIVIGLSLLAIQQAGVAPEISVDEFGAGTAPMAIAVCLIILSVIIVIEAYVQRGRDIAYVPPVDLDTEPTQTRVPFWQRGVFKGAGTIGLFLIFVALLEMTGVPFWLLTAAFLFLASRVIEGSVRRWLLLSLLMSLGLGVALDVIFARFLLIELP